MRFLIFAIALLLPFQADASPNTIRHGVEWCEQAIEAANGRAAYTTEATACINYLGGVYAVFTSYVLRWPACAPPSLLHEDFIKAFLAWAYRNPDVWNEPLFRGVMAMITEAYPCR